MTAAGVGTGVGARVGTATHSGGEGVYRGGGVWTSGYRRTRREDFVAPWGECTTVPPLFELCMTSPAKLQNTHLNTRKLRPHTLFV